MWLLIPALNSVVVSLILPSERGHKNSPFKLILKVYWQILLLLYGLPEIVTIRWSFDMKVKSSCHVLRPLHMPNTTGSYCKMRPTYIMAIIDLVWWLQRFNCKWNLFHIVSTSCKKSPKTGFRFMFVIQYFVTFCLNLCLVGFHHTFINPNYWLPTVSV